jgi:hypothetical protein
MIVASKHMQLTHSKRTQRHVINLHLEFVRKTQIGTAVFTVKDVKIGSRISNLRLTLSQNDERSDEMVDEVEGYIMMTDISAEDGISLDTGYKMSPPPLPVSLPDLAQGKDINYIRRGRDPVAHIRRAALNIELYLPRVERRSPEMPKAMVDQWVRFRPEGKSGKLTNDALGFVADIFPQIIEQYIRADLEAAMLGHDVSQEQADEIRKRGPPQQAFWYPTLNLNLDVKKVLPNEGVEWLFVRVQAYKIQNGRFDLQVTVLDDAGDLVATSSHSSLAVDISRNTVRSKKPKPSKI